MATYDPGNNNMIAIDGMLVERDALDIVTRIKEYDENLDVFCLDPDNFSTQLNDAPFIIVERCPDGVMRRVFEAWELDQRILERIYMADQNRHNALNILDEKQALLDLQRKRRYEERAARNQDLVATAVKHLDRNNNSRFKYRDEDTGDVITIHDDRPSERH